MATILSGPATPALPTVVIAGATGFVGRALAPRLAQRCKVIGLSRSARAPGPGDVGIAAWRKCDLFSLRDTEQALAGARWAVYLVHSMMPSARLSQGDFRDFDLICADNFARAAARVGVEHVVYLGGLTPDHGELSAHLASRLEVERTLASTGVPLTTLRAGIVLGAEGSSFQIMARLVRRLPVMVCPRWTRTRTQPIALDDVTQLLDHAVGRLELAGQIFDVGAEPAVTYRDMMETLAELLGLRRRMLTTRVLSPGLSRLWVTLVTGAPRALVGPLVESLRHEMVARDHALADHAGITLRPVRTALAEAVAAERASASGAGGGPGQASATRVAAEPLAFVGARAHTRARSARSVQRMALPAGRDAAWAAAEYMRWLPRALRGLVRVKVDVGGHCRFLLAGLGTELLALTHAPERSGPDRQLFYVTGGRLARPGKRARFELRQVLGGGTLLTAVHDYEPRLPWWLYTITQALFHRWVMWLFRRHLARAGRLAAAAGPAR